MMDISEIEELLGSNSGVSENLALKVSQRIRGVGLFYTNENLQFLYGNVLLEVQSEVNKHFKSSFEEQMNENIIKGVPANRGKVIGRARILSTYHDVKKMALGDIIVVSMTTPEYISAIEKASGFITDEGGITCHASIISREFNVPCVVGTNSATTKIRNGMIIELDAYNGIIRIIN